MKVVAVKPFKWLKQDIKEGEEMTLTNDAARKLIKDKKCVEFVTPKVKNQGPSKKKQINADQGTKSKSE